MTVANTFRSLSRLTGAKRYAGTVCAKHPELYGERITSNGTCLACGREKTRAQRAADPERAKAASRATYHRRRDVYLERGRIRGRMRRTGMDEFTYQSLLALQDGKCAICSRSVLGRTGHADHCHDTKKPRGLLCSGCNQAEGMIRRSGLSADEFGKRLSAYLAHPPAEKL